MSVLIPREQTSVCAASWLIARTGLLKGHSATSNMAFFNRVKVGVSHAGVAEPQAANSDMDIYIEWVPEAWQVRVTFQLNDSWLVSVKFWISSGVAAGIDMAAALMRHILSLHLPAAEAKKLGNQAMALLEVQ